MKSQAKSVKVVIIGNPGVGKTNIALRFTENKFSGSSPPTTSAVMKANVITIKDTAFKIDVWDTAGQEAYQSISRTYYQDVEVAIIVYDVTNRESFDNINFWLKQLKENNGGEIVTVIAGNKCDMAEKEVVTEEEERELAESRYALHFRTSAKDGTNITNMFMRICAELQPELKGKISEDIRERETVIAAADLVCVV